MSILDLYLRLSLEDDGIDESNSITSQRAIIKEFINRKDEFIGYELREHIDDGYSGTNFDRPAFQEMIELVKKNQVKVILVKDLSRFARDYIGAGLYLEQIFPFMNVRFISVNDSYDSNTLEMNAGLEIPFKNLINDYYVKDLSQKMRSSHKVMREKGYYNGIKPVYGYLKNPENHRQLIVDEYASKIVKEIYQRFLDGEPMRRIAEELTKRGELTPDNYFGFKHNDGIWKADSIKRILKNQVYTGKIVRGRALYNNLVEKRIVLNPKDKWIIVKDTHEPIISEETFILVQEAFAKNKKFSKRKLGNRHILADLTYCGICGKKMSYAVRNKVGCYMCIKKYNGESRCMKGKLNASELEKMISLALKEETQSLLTSVQIQQLEKEQFEKDKTKLELKRKELQRKVAELDKNRAVQYEKYKNGTIGKEEYLMEKEQTKKEIETLTIQISSIEMELQKNFDSDLVTTLEHLKSVTEKGILEKKWIDELIDKILIYDKTHIEVLWKFSKTKGGVR